MSCSLSVGRTAPSHKTCVRHHHHVLQEQKWPFEPQQISWQLSHELELSAKSSPACSSVDCKHRVGPSLSCVPVWLQSGDYHHAHDFNCAPVTGEVTRTGQAALSSLYWADRGVWPREQKGSVPASQTPQHVRLLQWKQNITGTVCFEETGLCLSHDTLFGIFFSLLLSSAFDASSGSVTFISAPKLFNVSHLRTKTKFKTVLYRDMIFVDDGAFTTHSEAALHRLINNSPAHMKSLASQSVSRKPVWVPRVSAIAWNQHPRPFSPGRRRIHLPWFHRLCELEPSLRNLT